jgi:hypothetical protein
MPLRELLSLESATSAPCTRRSDWHLADGSDPHAFDAGKKIKGKKRHILVDTQG